MLRITNPLVGRRERAAAVAAPGLLRAVAFNESHRRPGVALFEIGHVYPPGPGELPDEREVLGVVLAGREAPAAVAVWREIAAALGIGARIDQDEVPPGLHPTRSATLVAGRDSIGAVGEVAPDVLEAFGIDRAGRRCSSSTWPSCSPPSRSRRGGRRRAGIPRATSTWRSSLPDDVPAEKLEKAIRQGAGSLLVGLELFDVYRGAGVADGLAQPGVPPAPAGARPHAHRRRHGRRRRRASRQAAREARRHAPRR